MVVEVSRITGIICRYMKQTTINHLISRIRVGMLIDPTEIITMAPHNLWRDRGSPVSYLNVYTANASHLRCWSWRICHWFEKGLNWDTCRSYMCHWRHGKRTPQRCLTKTVCRYVEGPCSLVPMLCRVRRDSIWWQGDTKSEEQGDFKYMDADA